MTYQPQTLEDSLRRLIAEASLDLHLAHRKTLAELFGALCVYADMGGALAITQNLDVIHFDPEDGHVGRPTEEMRVFALNLAARRFPELKELAPVRPDWAIDCQQCEGTGMFGKLHCGQCRGGGWIIP